MSSIDRHLVEKIEILAGARTGAADKAAVRISDLRDLLQLDDVTATEVTSAPTADEYNALLREVKALNLRLRAVAKVLQGRILR